MQHLRQRGPHPRTLAGRKHHRQAGSNRHRNPLPIVPNPSGGLRRAVFNCFPPEIKPIRHSKIPGFKPGSHFLLMFGR
jgi:hypothetical protein